MYKKIFVPVDNSEHSITSIDIAVEFAKKFDGSLVGSHAYAARMHDYRFKQMEFTLPEEYLVEHEMEKQRKIHDSLITMGLELISDSYLVVMDARAKEAGLPFEPKMYDGKNYKIIAEDINKSDYDLVVMGALGLGAVKDSLIGSVCERVVRRVQTDDTAELVEATEDSRVGGEEGTCSIATWSTDGSNRTMRIHSGWRAG